MQHFIKKLVRQNTIAIFLSSKDKVKSFYGYHYKPQLGGFSKLLHKINNVKSPGVSQVQ